MNEETFHFKITDPYCPPVDPSMRAEITKSQARARFGEKSRTKIAEALSMPFPLDDKAERVIDEVSAWVRRLEYARVKSNPPKETGPTGKKNRRPPRVAVLQRNSTREIAKKAKCLLQLLATTDAPVRRRIRRQMSDPEEKNQTERKVSGKRRYKALVLGLNRLADAAERAEERLMVKIKTGRGDGKALTTLVHQFAAIWVMQTKDEPTPSTKDKPGTFNNFVDVVFEEAKLVKVDQVNLIKNVVKWRKKKIPRESFVDDEDSDNDYLGDSDSS